MRNYLFGLLLTIIPFTNAWSEEKSYAISKKIGTPKSSVVIADGKTGSRICYYDDRAYSIGAVIQVGEVYLVCQSTNDHELNGQLGWVRFNLDKPN